ncbi:MAG TPA: response regulator [Thermoanaerobaculia bacterium]|nr:response regulator [Thermoanaerobaculia bacterium]
MRQQEGKVVILTSDDVVAKQLERLTADDGLELIRTTSPSETWLAMNRQQPLVVIVDLTARSIDGHQLVALSGRARQSDTPLLLLSKQSRKDLASFAAVIRARDILSKGEPVANLAARIRMWAASAAACEFELVGAV